MSLNAVKNGVKDSKHSVRYTTNAFFLPLRNNKDKDIYMAEDVALQYYLKEASN